MADLSAPWPSFPGRLTERSEAERRQQEEQARQEANAKLKGKVLHQQEWSLVHVSSIFGTWVGEFTDWEHTGRKGEKRGQVRVSMTLF